MPWPLTTPRRYFWQQVVSPDNCVAAVGNLYGNIAAGHNVAVGPAQRSADVWRRPL